jgi:carbonic anhydrase
VSNREPSGAVDSRGSGGSLIRARYSACATARLYCRFLVRKRLIDGRKKAGSSAQLEMDVSETPISPTANRLNRFLSARSVFQSAKSVLPEPSMRNRRGSARIRCGVRVLRARCKQTRGRTHMNRRRFIRHAAGAAVAPATLWGVPTSRTLGNTPDSALQELVAGNQRFAANRLTSIEHDLEILKRHTVDKQAPFAAVLACADSRVPVELVFDQSIGQIFVTRVAGNLSTPEIIASLEYAVAVLGVKALLVLGHTNCGAVKAAMTADTVPGQISSLYPHLRPAVERAGGVFAKAIEENARFQSDLLRTSSTVIRDAIGKHTLDVRPAVYDLGSGKVSLL